MKQIVAWVNKWDQKQLEKYAINIYFAASLDDFENHLTLNSIPLFSLCLAASTYKKTKKITIAHPEIRFFFLQKRRTGLPVKTTELKLRTDANTEPSVILPSNVPGLL